MDITIRLITVNKEKVLPDARTLAEQIKINHPDATSFHLASFAYGVEEFKYYSTALELAEGFLRMRSSSLTAYQQDHIERLLFIGDPDALDSPYQTIECAIGDESAIALLRKNPSKREFDD